MLPPETVPHFACVDCGSDDIIDLGPCARPTLVDGLPSSEKQLNDSFALARLYRCLHCGLGFRFPQIDDEHLKRMYAEMPSRRWEYPESMNVAWTVARNWLRKRYRTRNIKILDVGAFDGAFLKSLPEDYRRHAIEPSTAARESLQSAGIQWIANYLDDPAADGRATFDVVTMFDVFEHLAFPSIGIANAIAYLKPGGRLFISTGNMDHWTWRLLRGDHWYCNPPMHVVFGTHRYFDRQARQNDSRVIYATNHAHQPGSLVKAVTEAFETLSFTARQYRPWWHPAAKALLHCPGFTYLRHKATAPYAPTLRDHLLVVIEKSS